MIKVVIFYHLAGLRKRGTLQSVFVDSILFGILSEILSSFVVTGALGQT